MELPSGYTSIERILSEKATGRLASTIGLIKDYQAPTATRGTDHKSTITIYDKSTEYELAGLPFCIFGKASVLNEMPQPDAGDVLVINSAKIQSYRDSISMVTHKSTSFHIYSASAIPQPPQSAKSAVRSSYGTRSLSDKEHEYASWLYHSINKSSVPDSATFQRQTNQSIRLKDKFCRLENVIDNQFCDVIVNVVKAPFDEVGRTTLWVSDYTQNDTFHKFSWDGPQQPGDQDGDSSSFLDTNISATSKWAGPFGKRSMQVTCFEPHASQVNSEVQVGQWIRIRNLRIKFGNNGLNLEGVLHEDRDYSDRRQVDILNWEKDQDPHLKEAIRRKRDYEKLKKKQMKSFAANENGGDTGTKRKAGESEEVRMNSKARRKEQRAAAKKKVEEQDKEAEERLGLNKSIKCESQEQPVTSLSLIIKPISWKTTVEGEETTLTLPFACIKYRTNVRVVGFRPRNLVNFATWRKSTEYDAISDCSSESSSESDDGYDSQARYSGTKIWEWRFALQLEDVGPKSIGEKERLWAVVDNNEAQQLTSLDACDLREDVDTLNSLREQLFKLWGNLEEVESQEQERQTLNRLRVAANQPPPSSPAGTDPRRAGGAENTERVSLSNKPFSCCIRQYGVRVPEPDLRRADAGEGFRWTRVFGLFGTKISL
ncbi:hypothetical protein F4777DRAFT_526963 [Nemania sp. FL0916]|nr:hypothetical protein F4777DRAFT_526963 [Nemania sp. FL0916]